MNRRFNINAIEEKVFDLIIIGGGITGAGILREATRRGYCCLLLEKGDFASGTSSKSAKLIHGGIRYLKYGKLGLIKESLEERNYLLKTYPHLVKPLPFLFPIYESSVKYRIGMAMYHYLDNQKSLPDYQYLEKEDVIKTFPPIDSKNLQAGFIYYDAVTNDARLCNEVIHAATQSRNASALNYCEMQQVEQQDDVMKVYCTDHISNKPVQFTGRFIANAGGVWMDHLLEKFSAHTARITAPSKGIHIVLSKTRFPLETALVVPSYTDDGRMNYALPWENNTVIVGTTDTEYSGPLDTPAAAEDDVHYILHSIQHFAPALNITARDILCTYAGLRPLFHEEKNSYARSRDYSIWWSGEHILNIYGGKLTGFHSMAQSFLDELRKKEKEHAAQPEVPQPAALLPLPKDLPEHFTLRIKAEYADASEHIFSIAREYESYHEKLSEHLPYTIAELIYFIRHQQCYHLDDLLTRRLPVTYSINGLADKEKIIRKTADVMRAECEWSEEEYRGEIQSFHEKLKSAAK